MFETKKIVREKKTLKIKERRLKKRKWIDKEINIIRRYFEYIFFLIDR